MRSVNLIPTDAGRGAGGLSAQSFSPAHAVLLALAVALAFVTVYVLTSNTISQRTANLAALKAEAARTTAQAASLTKYSQFEQLANARAETVRSIAASRFDWYSALSDLSKVVPANTSLQSLVATVSPTASAGGSGASTASSGGLRGDEPGPAFELAGCTQTQDDVARLMSRLRLINGVTRVTLQDSQKPDSTGAAAAPPSSTGSGAAGCGPGAPTFNVVVFFQPLSGPAASAAQASPSTSTTSTSTTSTTPTTSTSTTTSSTPTTGTAPATTGTSGAGR